MRIVKLDAATNAGPKLGLRSQEQNSCAYRNQPLDGHKLRTDESGQATSPMSPGTFTIYESKAPEGYLPSGDSWSYTVGADQLGDSGVVEIESRVSDIPIAFDLEISKFKDYGSSDQSGLEQPAGGVVFEVVSNSSHQVVGTLTTNIYGFASTKDQPEAWFGTGKRPAGVHGAVPYDRAGYTVREVPETVPRVLNVQGMDRRGQSDFRRHRASIYRGQPRAVDASPDCKTRCPNRRFCSPSRIHLPTPRQQSRTCLTNLLVSST